MRLDTRQVLADADGGADEPEDEREFDFVLPRRQVMNDLFRHCLFHSPVFAGDDF